MYNTTVKKTLLFISLFIILVMACDLSVAVSPSTSPAPLPTNTVIAPAETFTSIPATAAPAPTSTLPPPSFEGAEVFFGSLRLVLPPGLASGVRGSQLPRVDGEDSPIWGRTPGHTQLTLEGYLLQGKFHQPQILVYPAQGYAELVPGAFESLHRLNNILGGMPLSSEQLPAIASFNAQQVFASHMQLISFQNGRGVRFLTEYGQYAVSANNNELFYHFQG